MSKFQIMTILVNHRKSEAERLQQLLTEFGCNIKMRLGLHETKDICAEDGLIILQMDGDEKDIHQLKDGLEHIDGVKVQLITMTSD